MTIAVCMVSPEGVILGADSTSSALIASGPGSVGYHFFNHAQKVFQIGEASTVGLVTWGLGGLGQTSHRTLIARLADDLKTVANPTVMDVATRWAALFWGTYSPWLGSPEVGFTALKAKLPFDPAANPPNPAARTQDEEQRFNELSHHLYVGFAIGGYFGPDREPKAFSVEFQPLLGAAPVPVQLLTGTTYFWGVPNMILRLVRGYDENLLQSILASGKWNGNDVELRQTLAQHALSHAILPIRDAIDYVHACIASTIKALKFSSLFQTCGGPIELAVVTTDRHFRWVRHKPWDAAIEEGNFS